MAEEAVAWVAPRLPSAPFPRRPPKSSRRLAKKPEPDGDAEEEDGDAVEDGEVLEEEEGEKSRRSRLSQFRPLLPVLALLPPVFPDPELPDPELPVLLDPKMPVPLVVVGVGATCAVSVVVGAGVPVGARPRSCAQPILVVVAPTARASSGASRTGKAAARTRNR